MKYYCDELPDVPNDHCYSCHSDWEYGYDAPMDFEVEGCTFFVCCGYYSQFDSTNKKFKDGSTLHEWWNEDRLFEEYMKQCPFYISQTGGPKDLPGKYGPGTCMGGCHSEPACMT